MAPATLEIVARRRVEGLATLHLGRFSSEPRGPVEFVDTLEPGIPKAKKWVMMISTQVGCPVGCRMCDAGAIGFRGNLSAEQMLGQVRHMLAENPELDVSRHPKLKIHFARMGEPSLNFEVVKALEGLALEFPFPGVMPSVSTVAPKSPAVLPFFEALLEVKERRFPRGRFQLQFSLHAADEERRRRIVPIRTWSLSEIGAYGERFVRPGDRKVTLNFALGRGETFDPARLRQAFSPEKFLVKITPVNPTRTAAACGAAYPWARQPAALGRLAGALRGMGFEVILSPSLPEEIAAETSCGQLWSAPLKETAATAMRNRAAEAGAYVTSRNLGEKARAWMKELSAGRRRDFPVRPQSAGLLVLDMQEFFLSPRSPAYLPPARAVLGNAARLAEAFRRAGRPVFLIRHAHEDPARDGGLMAGWWRKVCLAGSPESRISPRLEPRTGEVFGKCRYSAFSNGALVRSLRARGVEQLVVAGIVTNLCVESTVRDAFDLGFATIVAADATAAHTEDFHKSSLKTLAQGFSSVRLSDEILETLGTRRP